MYRRCCITLFPQDIRAFPENGNARVLRLYGTQGFKNELTDPLQKCIWVQHAIHHARGQQLISINRDVSSLLKSSSNILAARLQTSQQSFPMCAGSDDQSSIAGIQSGPDESRQLIKKLPIVGIKHCFVALGNLPVRRPLCKLLWFRPCAGGIMLMPVVINVQTRETGTEEALTLKNRPYGD